MKLKANLAVPKVDRQYLKVLQAHIGEALGRGTWEWIEAVLAKIPVWSGASHATFMAISREISFSLTISPVVKSRIPLGASQGAGEVRIDPSAGLYTFTYYTTLPHLVFNEHHNANLSGYRLRNPGPYNFQAAGQEAFLKYAATVRLPVPRLKVSRLKV